MLIAKFAKQKIENLEKFQPDLIKSIRIHFTPEVVKNATYEELLGMFAGFGIEIVLKSGGNSLIFEDNLTEQFQRDEFQEL